MKRLITTLAVAGLLVACSAQGNGTTQSTAPGASTAASAGASDAASTGSGGSASAACTEAFAPLADLGITKTSELGDLTEDVQPTVEACESVTDWIAGAQTVVEDEVRPGTADLLLRMLCDDQSLTRTAICEELG
jgi:long-subunit fatty acid transport protein